MIGKIALGAGLAMIASVGALAAPRTAKTPLRLNRVSVTLPQDFDRTYPAGTGSEAADTHCRACHSPAMVLVQPPLSRAEWGKEVRKMIDTYKAPIPESEVPALVDYLAGLTPVRP